MGWDGILQQALTALSGVTPAQWCQTFFLLAAGGVLAVAAMPRDAKALLMDYGARNAQKLPADGPPPRDSESGWLLSLLATITSWTQVPHSWFSAFYVVSLACSVFWLTQYLGDGAVLRFIGSSQAAAQGPSSTSGQVALGWLMMFLQAARRVFEHATIIKPSKSTMWVVHWLLGLFFYLFIGVSVWVEGSGMAPSR
jgi:3-oxo-5-alpha-steroid 4-dehydrogenase 3